MMLDGVLIQTPFWALHEVWSIVAEDSKGKVPRAAQKKVFSLAYWMLAVGS